MNAQLLVARAILVVGFLLFAAAAGAAEIKVMSSAGFKAAYDGVPISGLFAAGQDTGRTGEQAR
jgi:hypothetical protein